MVLIYYLLIIHGCILHHEYLFMDEYLILFIIHAAVFCIMNTFQVQPYVDHVIVILEGDNKGMGDSEQGLLAQEWVQVAHYLKMCIGSPNHGCYLLFKHEL